MTTLTTSSRSAVRRRAWVKAGLLLALLVVLLVLALQFSGPEVAAIRRHVEDAGPWGPLVFYVFYVGVSLLPAPKNLLTIAGGLLFGLVPGAALALAGATTGAMLSFAGARVLGRSAIEQIGSPRMVRIDRLLRDHGFATVLVLRLLPVVPYTAVNYAAGVSAVRALSFLLASAVGMIPGSLAYAAFGAYGATDPWRTAVAGSGLLLLLVIGGLLARRLPGHTSQS
ncbi:TVP38/TMEM64 family protein [Nocardioides sp.]|uniref:TVP38/TMEM64 family protein n=1 Tax=Nocardioides sp. TaxID=35761 RepID=UPI003568A1BF